MRSVKTLIRLGGCPGWSESSLGAHSLCWFCHVAAHIYMYGASIYLRTLVRNPVWKKVWNPRCWVWRRHQNTWTMLVCKSYNSEEDSLDWSDSQDWIVIVTVVIDSHSCFLIELTDCNHVIAVYSEIKLQHYVTAYRNHKNAGEKLSGKQFLVFF